VYPIAAKNANASEEARRSSMRSVGLVAFLVFVLSLALAGWHNDFPPSYHPDEPEKVAQVIDGHRDFHHPPLMLDAATAVLHLVSNRDAITSDRVAQVGRCLSAFYMGAACGVFTLLAGFYGGSLAAIFAACLLAGNAHAVLAGHFFKEDSLFALGLSLTFLAGAYRWRGHLNWLSLIILGATAGFTTASKYIGVLALIYAVVLELSLSRRVARTGLRLYVLFATAVAAVFLLSVHSWWNRFPAIWRALFEAGQTAYLGNYGVGTKVPHLRFVGMLFLEPPLALLGLLLCWWQWVGQSRPIRQQMDRWLLLSAPVFLLLVFSFSTITAVRYFLPISLLIACLGGCGQAAGTQMLCQWMHQRWKTPPSFVVFAALVLCGLCQLPGIISLERGFATDDRRALRYFISSQLPADAVIDDDVLADIDAAPRLPQRLVIRKTIADLGDLTKLPAQGITYVVVCWYDSRRYVNPSKHPAANAASDFARRRAFYLGLREHAQLLWHSDLEQPFPLRPGLSLYKLSSVPAATNNSQ
jgi:hypothetical protein